jgi:DNA-binding XRE family transcriptional regulator
VLLAPSCIHVRLRALRKACGWTQQQLAHAAGCSRECISQIEQHKTLPSLLLLLRMQVALEVDSLDAMLERPGCPCWRPTHTLPTGSHTA